MIENELGVCETVFIIDIHRDDGFARPKGISFRRTDISNDLDVPDDRQGSSPYPRGPIGSRHHQEGT